MPVTFTFNGKTNHDFGLLIRDIKRSVLPPISYAKYSAAGRVGYHLGGRAVGGKEFTITFVLPESTLEDFQSKREAIAEWLDQEGEKPFTFSDEPNRIYYGSLEGSSDINQIICTGTFDLTFICPYPRAESEDDFTQQLSGGIVEKQLFTTQSDWTTNTTLTNTDATSLAGDVVLTKAGTDQTFTNDNVWNGTLTDLVNDNGWVRLPLVVNGGTSVQHRTDVNDDWNLGTMTQNITVSNGRIGLERTNYTFKDNMRNYIGTNWKSYGSSYISQNTYWVSMNSEGLGTGSGIRQEGRGALGMTADLYVRTTYSGTATPDFFVHVSNGTTHWRDLQLPTDVIENGSWFWLRVRVTAGGQIYVYKNGVASSGNPFSMNTTSVTSNRFEIGIDSIAGANQYFDVQAVYIINSDLGAPAGNYYNTTGTWEIDINLDSVKDVQSTLMSWNPLLNSQINDSSMNVITVETSLNGGSSWSTATNNSSISGISEGDNLTGITLKVRITLNSKDPATTPNVTVLRVDIFAKPNEYGVSGTYLSVPITILRNATRVSSTRISWVGNFPAGTSIQMETNVSLAGVYLGWRPVNLNDPIPDIPPNTNVSAATVLYRFTLTTNDTSVTPAVDRVVLYFDTGYGNSGSITLPAIDLSSISSNGNPAGASIISWDSEVRTVNGQLLPETATEKITVQTSLDNGSTWQNATNTGEIPNLKGIDTTGKDLLIRALFQSSNAVYTPILHSIYFEIAEDLGTTVIYNGSAISYPIIRVEFTASASSIRIRHLETEKEIFIDMPFNNGDILEINNATQKIMLNGQYSADAMKALNVLESDWLYLVKGDNNFSSTPSDGVVINLDWKEYYK